jgi:hypothetical protein
MVGALAMSLGRSFLTLVPSRFVTSVGIGFAHIVASPAGDRTALMCITMSLGANVTY